MTDTKKPREFFLPHDYIETPRKSETQIHVIEVNSELETLKIEHAKLKQSYDELAAESQAYIEFIEKKHYEFDSKLQAQCERLAAAHRIVQYEFERLILPKEMTKILAEWLLNIESIINKALAEYANEVGSAKPNEEFKKK